VQTAKVERALGHKLDDGPGEGDPATTRWEMDYALLGQLRERKERIEQACRGRKRVRTASAPAWPRDPPGPADCVP
jgi:hypothetical protein